MTLAAARASLDRTASLERPLPFIRRQDVEARPVDIRGRRWWRLKDPLSLRFWQLGEEEHFLWRQLERGVGLADLEQRFRHRFAPRHIDSTQLQNYLATLHREGLIYSTGGNQATVLADRLANSQARERWLWWTNPLAIRFRGINPAPFFDRVVPRLSWLFSPSLLAAVLLLWASAVWLLVTRIEQLAGRWPTTGDFLTGSNLAWLAITLGGVKVAHELGHAIACHRFGGQCHELGIMFLVLTPCLYCNVSDAWLIPSRWRRMAISAAGMVVEWTLAAAATWIWAWSPPGAWSTWSLNVMVVCSINTLVLNGNPLLRYDGYFLLSDWLELPNLRAAGDAWVRSKWAWCWGLESEHDSPPATQDGARFVAAFGVASLVYRVFLTMTIGWLLYGWLAERGVGFLGVGMLLLTAASWGGQTAWRIRRRQASFSRHRRNWGRAATTLVLLLALAAVVGFIPWPTSVVAPAVLEPAEIALQFVTVPGIIEETVSPGIQVQAGDPLARLRNDDLTWEIQRLEIERDLARQQLETLRKMRVQESLSGGTSARESLPLVEQQLADLEARLRQKSSEQTRLTIRATRGGTVFPPRAKRPSEEPDELRTWNQTPLAAVNRGGYLETGVILCQVGNRRSEFKVVVEQSDIDAVRVGQTVTAWLTEAAGKTWRGRVHRIEELQIDAVSPDLLARRLLPSHGDPREPRLVGTYFQVVVALDEPVGSATSTPWGATGRARIRVAPQTLANRLYHWLSGLWITRAG